MKNIIHVVYTWLIAVIVAVFWLVAYEYVTYAWQDTGTIFPRLLFTIVPGSYIVATPALVLSIAFFCFLIRADYSAYEKLFLWYLSALLAVFLNILLAVVLFGMTDALYEILGALWPAFPAAVIAITIRRKQFILLNNKITHHETNMV